MADEKLQAELRALAVEPVADADAVRSAAYFTSRTRALGADHQGEWREDGVRCFS